MTESLVDTRIEVHESDICEGVMVRPFCVIRDSTIGPDCKIYEGAKIKKSRLEIGCDINCGAYLEQAFLGKNVQVAPNCTIVGVKHEFSHEGVSHDDIVRRIYIGDGCWLGAGCKILPGVTIGRNCVIGAGAVVNKDIPDGHVYVGTPLKYKLYPIGIKPVWCNPAWLVILLRRKLSNYFQPS